MYHHNYVVDTLNVSMQVKREKVSDLHFFVVQNLILFKLRGGWAAQREVKGWVVPRRSLLCIIACAVLTRLAVSLPIVEFNGTLLN